MKFTASLILATALLFAACGDDDADLRSDPDVQAILEGYERLGASEAELDQMIEDIDAALDVYDNEADRRDYLRDLREMAEMDVNEGP